MADEEDYFTPEQSEILLRRAADVLSGADHGVSIGDMVADRERDPRMKALMDEARARLRARKAAGCKFFEVREIVLTERGLNSVPRAD